MYADFSVFVSVQCIVSVECVSVVRVALCAVIVNVFHSVLFYFLLHLTTSTVCFFFFLSISVSVYHLRTSSINPSDVSLARAHHNNHLDIVKEERETPFEPT